MATGYAVEASVEGPYVKKSKTSWFKRKFAQWCREAWEDESPGAKSLNVPVGLRDIEPARLQSNGMRFTVYKAQGGYVIETGMHDRRKDDYRAGMYVITEDKDLGEELGKIITMENLRV